ncbi:DHH family phosphoesterase [Candidatus Woesearchaeota archaeon]|nr:DHH family phosphoesterase [Candidatus Woesearchaeota archaeon]
MLAKKEIKEIRKELSEASNPLFFFHDDPDGVCSFLQLYRYVREGHGIIIKTTPNIGEKFLRKVEEYKPDKIFIVDIAMVEQDFIDKAKTKIIWIDHHTPLKRTGNVKYYNPRIKHPKKNVPVSYMCHQIVEQDLWIAMTGCIGDWYWPDFANKFKKEYPDLIAKPIKEAEIALFTTELGKLVRIFSFILKGKMKDVMKCIRILTRINSPYEILRQENSAGRFIYKRFEKMDKEYQKMLKYALSEGRVIDELLIYTYIHKKISFTSDLANELMHRYPNRIVIIAREKSGEMRMSLRSKTRTVLPILTESLKGIKGYGGGHEFACGANVAKEDFNKFIENTVKQI